MQITDETIQHIAHLSRLQFEGEEFTEIRTDLTNIVSFMETLQELDTTGVEPLIFMNDAVNVLRTDTAVVTVTQKEALKNAPKKDSDYFRIPKVLSK
jgi:aspartyl-tRNA(Asn)/glutamyl-tRNA(Gln) amidotransferase subunit C